MFLFSMIVQYHRNLALEPDSNHVRVHTCRSIPTAPIGGGTCG